MSEWITNRSPRAKDADSNKCVWVTYNGKVAQWHYDGVFEGTPWMPITEPEPYVKPKRFRVEQTALDGRKCFAVYDDGNDLRCSFYLPTREAAERIAAIYEEVMP